jgi:hypothetical protein
MSSAPIATLQRCRSCKGSGRKGSELCLRCGGSGYVVISSGECGCLAKLGDEAEASAPTTASRSGAAQLDAGRNR